VTVTIQSSPTGQIQGRLDRLREHDGNARDELINEACERLRQLTRRMLGDFSRLRRWEQTDDVLQNAVIRLHRSLAEVHPDSPRGFFRLAATQIRRELIDLCRHYFGPEGAGAHHLTDGAGSDDGGFVRHDPSDDTNEPTSVLEWTEFHDQVAKLGGPEREVFTLKWYQGLKTAEIAAVVGVSERTVKRRWRSACLFLFKAHKGQMPGE
jgi:RNA polymerase sigma-70 factor (ECF subfamily)